MDTEPKMVEEPLRIAQFEVGDFVFAKLKGYPPWPAKIDQIETNISGGKTKTRYNVYFFGSHQASNLSQKALLHYYTNAKSIVEKWGRKPKFHDALKELEREMMDKATYIHQLKAPAPETTWCNGFDNACDNLANDITGAKQRSTSKNHKKASLTDEVEKSMEEEIVDESRRLGYEVMYVERIPYPDDPDALIILSLSFNKDWVKEEIERIKEEERMMNCFVKIEPFPPEYAHLDPDSPFNHISEDTAVSKSLDKRENQQTPGKSSYNIPAVPKTEIITPEKINNGVSLDLSSDEEIIETCPVCRSSFFSLADLKKHEETVHGTVSTAESLFDRLFS